MKSVPRGRRLQAGHWRGPGTWGTMVWMRRVWIVAAAAWSAGACGHAPVAEPLPAHLPTDFGRRPPSSLPERLFVFGAERTRWTRTAPQPEGPWPLEVLKGWRGLLDDVEPRLAQPVRRSDLRLLRVGLEAELEACQAHFGPAPEYLAERLALLWARVDRHLKPPATPWRFVREWPVTPVIVTSGFGWRRDPVASQLKFHSGVDLSGRTGDVVCAAAAGTVDFAGWKGGYGRLVVVTHEEGWSTYYGHLEKVLVSEGSQVDPGSPVGLMGSTGRSTGPHLHFEVRLEDEPRPPREFIDIRTVRSDIRTAGPNVVP